jgi:hypothetical protein
VIRKRFSIAFAGLLLAAGTIAGCSVANPTAAAQATVAQIPATIPVEHTAIPTPETTLTMALPEAQPASLVNPGFEDGDPGGAPAGWIQIGDVAAVKLEEKGLSGNLRLTHQACKPVVHPARLGTLQRGTK